MPLKNLLTWEKKNRRLVLTSMAFLGMAPSQWMFPDSSVLMPHSQH